MAEAPHGTSTTDTPSDGDTRFFGQPWALAHVFGVEMWARSPARC